MGMYINYKTEFSMGAVFAPLEKVVEKAASMANYAGIADLCNTYGHVSWDKACRKHGIKPIFGVQLPVVEGLDVKGRDYPLNWMTFIAKNNEGLEELYALVDTAHKQFYYLPRLSYEQVNGTSHNLLLFSENNVQKNLPSRFSHLMMTPCSAHHQEGFLIPGIDNYYIDVHDKAAYEAFAEEFKLERKTTAMHVLTEREWLVEVSKIGDFENLRDFAKICNATLPSAPMVKWEEDGKSVGSQCDFRLRELGLAYSDEYNRRLVRELKTINEKNFKDYFLVVADLVKYAKTKMLVGPARGSAAGSLICYLLGITEVDPIKYGLYFERFVDLNRDDLPDIDIDFPDDKRHLIIRYLEKKYGKDNVVQIANIGRLKPKSALNRVSKNLHIPLDEIEEIKNISENLKDTFENTEIGKAFIEKYPAMKVAADLEGHASYIGKHAAGVLVCNKPVHKYCGINSRGTERLAMIDKRDAEALNLLKIDALGLRTLSIIAEVCDDIGKPYSWIHELPVDDSATYKVFNDHRFGGIFQFEGDAVQGLAKRMPIETIEDISAVSALGRPGPLGSGAAWDYVNANAGREPVKWISERSLVQAATEETYGVIVYQEQVMRIAREVGCFSWKNTGRLRKVIAKTMGDEISQFEGDFINGAVRNGLEYEEAKLVWGAIKTFGGYAFNKSHSVSYGLISYFCAYLKAHYPLEFAKACLNHSKDDNSALKILRDVVETEGVKYQHIDLDHSMQKWSVFSDDSIMTDEDFGDEWLLGGFLSLHGIGPANANKIVKLRKEGISLPPGIQKHLDNDISPFKYLYPAKEIYGDYYADHKEFGINNPVMTIREVKKNNGTFNFIGKLTEMSPRDLNEAALVTKRNNQYASGQTAYLLFVLEDDTDSIRCKIEAEDYSRLGRQVVESGKLDLDWYAVCGQRLRDWNIIFVKNIRRITR